ERPGRFSWHVSWGRLLQPGRPNAVSFLRPVRGLLRCRSVLSAAVVDRARGGLMLISCVAYEDGKKIGDIEPQDIHRYLVRPNGFVWVALREPDPRTLELMQAEFDLHPLAVEDARHGHQRPKIEEYA